jgi:cyclopropane fatty-acyl-phospholipid synthase-like methyltransferase
MTSLEESVVSALDGYNQTELFPFLPYILQDFWEIGADPVEIIKMIQKHAKKPAHELRVLDLGCGKGAVSIQLASAIGCSCLGIDAVKEFIAFANKKAVERKVSHLCTFEVGDIRLRVNTLHKFDIIILGAIGSVLGNTFDTISAIKRCLKHKGFILIDDGYIPENSNLSHPNASKKSEILAHMEKAGMQLKEEAICQNDDEAAAMHSKEFSHIENRCKELIEEYPDKRSIFENYVSNQKKEYEAIENDFINSLMVIA